MIDLEVDLHDIEGATEKDNRKISDAIERCKVPEAEIKVGVLLANAWNEYIKLEKQFPGENKEFGEGINICQHLMALRVARRVAPSIYPIKEVE